MSTHDIRASLERQRDALAAEVERLREALMYAWRKGRSPLFDFDEWARLVEHAIKGERAPNALENEIAAHAATHEGLKICRAEVERLHEARHLDGAAWRTTEEGHADDCAGGLLVGNHPMDTLIPYGPCTCGYEAREKAARARLDALADGASPSHPEDERRLTDVLVAIVCALRLIDGTAPLVQAATRYLTAESDEDKAGAAAALKQWRPAPSPYEHPAVQAWIAACVEEMADVEIAGWCLCEMHEAWAAIPADVRARIAGEETDRG